VSESDGRHGYQTCRCTLTCKHREHGTAFAVTAASSAGRVAVEVRGPVEWARNPASAARRSRNHHYGRHGRRSGILVISCRVGAGWTHAANQRAWSDGGVWYGGDGADRAKQNSSRKLEELKAFHGNNIHCSAGANARFKPPPYPLAQAFKLYLILGPFFGAVQDGCSSTLGRKVRSLWP
jgi:hypothetical protein